MTLLQVFKYNGSIPITWQLSCHCLKGLWLCWIVQAIQYLKTVYLACSLKYFNLWITEDSCGVVLSYLSKLKFLFRKCNSQDASCPDAVWKWNDYEFDIIYVYSVVNYMNWTYYGIRCVPSGIVWNKHCYLSNPYMGTTICNPGSLIPAISIHGRWPFNRQQIATLIYTGLV